MTTAQKQRAIRAQIRAKKAIRFTYEKDGKGKREGNPHTLGIANGKSALRIYQTSKTPSDSGIKGNNSPEDFRFFYLESIDNIEELRDTFNVHPSFKSGDAAFDSIDTEVEVDE